MRRVWTPAIALCERLDEPRGTKDDYNESSRVVNEMFDVIERMNTEHFALAEGEGLL